MCTTHEGCTTPTPYSCESVKYVAAVEPPTPPLMPCTPGVPSGRSVLRWRSLTGPLSATEGNTRWRRLTTWSTYLDAGRAGADAVGRRRPEEEEPHGSARPSREGGGQWRERRLPHGSGAQLGAVAQPVAIAVRRLGRRPGHVPGGVARGRSGGHGPGPAQSSAARAHSARRRRGPAAAGWRGNTSSGYPRIGRLVRDLRTTARAMPHPWARLTRATQPTREVAPSPHD